MDIKDILARCDHTLLRTDCTAAEIRALCDDAIRFGCASVCIPPAHVAGAKRYVNGQMKICTVIGFPNGYNTTAAKVFETEDAVKNGADEIDMVINLGMVKDKCWDMLLDEIVRIKAACGGKLLKVIIECCLLTDEEKIKLCEIVSASGAEYIKTSTGFSKGGATFDDVALMRAHCAPTVKVSRGCRTLHRARRGAPRHEPHREDRQAARSGKNGIKKKRERNDSFPFQSVEKVRLRPGFFYRLRILCVFSTALTPYEGISARQNRVCPCRLTQIRVNVKIISRQAKKQKP